MPPSSCVVCISDDPSPLSPKHRNQHRPCAQAFQRLSKVRHHATKISHGNSFASSFTWIYIRVRFQNSILIPSQVDLILCLHLVSFLLYFECRWPDTISSRCRSPTLNEFPLPFISFFSMRSQHIPLGLFLVASITGGLGHSSLPYCHLLSSIFQQASFQCPSV